VRTAGPVRACAVWLSYWRRAVFVAQP
jgi:hypothetical protein